MDEVEMLDALNDDCRRLVLSYVPVRDIVRAERVSRSWRKAVLQYLRSVHIRIENTRFRYEKTRGFHCRILQLEAIAEWFVQVTTKLGSTIVASYCFNECTLLTLLHNCPNLVNLAVNHLYFEATTVRGDGFSFTEEVYNFGKLKQITFEAFTDIDEDCILKFIGNGLEEFTIIEIEKVTGRCLLSLPLNLKSLNLIGCDSLQLQHLLAVVKKLPLLRKLELADLAPDIFQNAPVLLHEVPNLEELSLNFKPENKLKDDIAQSISQLRQLKRLDFIGNRNVPDEWLVAIGRGCRQLQELNFAACTVSPGAVVTLCNAVGLTLTVLDVAAIPWMTDEHVLDIIGSCPNLESLDVSHCRLLENFTAEAVTMCATRARPLRLRAENTQLRRNNVPFSKRGTIDVYPGLTIDYGDIDLTTAMMTMFMKTAIASDLSDYEDNNVLVYYDSY